MKSHRDGAAAADRSFQVSTPGERVRADLDGSRSAAQVGTDPRAGIASSGAFGLSYPLPDSRRSGPEYHSDPSWPNAAVETGGIPAVSLQPRRRKRGRLLAENLRRK